MPHTIVTKDGTEFAFHEYELPPLGPQEVQIQVTFAAPKHGTEAHLIRGSAHDLKRWDPDLRMFLPRPAAAPAPPPIERAIGNIVVGTVGAIGAAVTRFSVGERVFAYAPISEVCQLAEDRCYSAAGLSDADAVCVDPAHVALVAVRDGSVRVGDTVAVYGLGAIGLCAVQIARIGGARTVCAVDPIARRRAYAIGRGADVVIDPTAVDAALQIKLATGRKGVDVAIETSGSDRALHDSIRCLRQCGTVVHVAWGPTAAPQLHLDEEFHINRPLIVGSQAWAGWGNPDRSYPRWDHERAYAAAVELFQAGLLTGAGMVDPIVSFADAPAALRAIMANPETTIKVGVRF
jgi:threonine dehydrogenase-like Zn-dependent dehydrogenase